MNRAQLLAHLDNYGHNMTEITGQEYNEALYAHIKTLENPDSFRLDDTTFPHGKHANSYKFSIDGCDYIYYSVAYNVGWQGDIDCDGCYVKIPRTTKAEWEKIRDLMTSPGFEY